MNSLLKFRVQCSLFTLAALALSLSFLTGCGTAQYQYPESKAPSPGAPTNTAVTTPVSVPTADSQAAATNTADQLYAGYRITIIFAGIPNPPPKHEEKIRDDGFITPPYLGRPVMAAGKTVGQLQDELQKLYVPDYFTRALSVIVKTDDLFFFVTGEVKSPGQKPYLSAMTVLSAIQAAGGFTEYANKKNVQIIRVNNSSETLNCDRAIKNPKLDKAIFPGDKILVKSRIL
jgi:polysaccharide export outer membrane protein